ncbi:MAG: universal stress protein [Gammaproteobacteria bacterium]|nr:universal stress protein [Gammaproteobacteria bacterium]
MKRILVVADAADQPQHTIRRAVNLNARLGARLDIVGFVYEHIINLPEEISAASVAKIKKAVANKRAEDLKEAVTKAVANHKMKTKVEVHWEKRISDWINERLKEKEYDLVVKGGNRTETMLYTPTDWQIFRSSKAPVLLFAEKRWKKGAHVLAAVDLGTRSSSKKKLNHKIIEHAWEMAKALECKLHVVYAIPISKVLIDLEVLDRRSLRKEGKRLAEKFCARMESKGVEIEGVHVTTGAPEKVLVSTAAKQHARLVVLGCVGRKQLAGRVIGNTAEKILRLVRADVLTIKP